MASLKFHKVADLPASCALGDVYYVANKGIYVCTTAASSGATEAANYQRFSYANDAASDVKGVTSLSDAINSSSSTVAASSKAVKTAYDKAAAAETAADSKEPKNTAVRHPVNSSVGNEYQPVYVASNGNVSSCTFTLRKSVPSDAVFTDTHNKHGHTFSPNTATSTASTATSVDVVSALNNASETSGNLSSTYNMVKVPTLKVTNDLATRISANEKDIDNLQTVASTGMQYKGAISSIGTSTAYVAGSVYRVSTKISIPVAQSATGAAITAEVGDFMVCSTAGTGNAAKWDVWQANVNNDAYFASLPASGDSAKFLIPSGTAGALTVSNYTAASFDKAGAATTAKNEVLGTSADDATKATVYGAIAKATAVQTNLTNHINNKENPHEVTKAQVGLGNVTNNAQVKGLASGTTPGHFVTWGADGYTVADSGKSASSFDAAGAAATAKSEVLGTNADAAGTATVYGALASAKAAKSAADKKWTKAYAHALASEDGSKAGIATFNSSNFTVSEYGHVDLIWATWIAATDEGDL